MTNYASCASGILEAWQQRNLPRLRDQLDMAASLHGSSAWDDGESERLELLESIAAQLRVMVAHGRMEPDGTYSKLLRHLAAGE